MERYAEKSGPYAGMVDVEDYKEMAKETGKLPRVLKEMPELDSEYRHYFNAWDQLRGFKRKGRISIESMVNYLEINSGFDKKEFIQVINAMDISAGF